MLMSESFLFLACRCGGGWMALPAALAVLYTSSPTSMSGYDVVGVIDMSMVSVSIMSASTIAESV